MSRHVHPFFGLWFTPGGRRASMVEFAPAILPSADRATSDHSVVGAEGDTRGLVGTAGSR
jgi:hypothetical protein